MSRGGLVRFGALGLLLAAVGCASSTTPPPATRSEAPPAAVQPEPPAPTPPPVTPPVTAAEPVAEPVAEADASSAYGQKTVYIGEPETEEEAPPTLAEAAQLARERRAEEGGELVAVITDETLSEYATGEISEAAEKPGAQKSAPSDPAASETASEKRGEEYWRTRVRDARLSWRDLVEELEQLENESQDLRRRFYAEDDGFYRDSQIKPAWDRALDRLAEVRDQLLLARDRVEIVLQEGRLAGALPGWLREGIEYEPEPEEPEEGLGIHEASEPKVIDEDQGDGR